MSSRAGCSAEHAPHPGPLPDWSSEARQSEGGARGSKAADSLRAMNRIAEAYVKLVLALGRHDPDYVDAYYGPEAWREEAAKEIQPLEEIRDAAVALARAAAITEAPDEARRLRQRYLARMLEAVAVRAEMLAGKKLSF